MRPSPYALHRRAALAMVAGLALWTCAASPPAVDPVEAQRTRLLLVRHAEKQDEGFNPDLTPDGAARAERLAEIAADAGVEAIYTTEFCRTALTAQPAANTSAAAHMESRRPWRMARSALAAPATMEPIS